MDTAKVYPDQPDVQSRTDRTWVLGKREDKFAIVPTQEGTMVLPEIRIPWWDTQADRERVIVIPAREFNVLPGSAEATVPLTSNVDRSTQASDRSYVANGGRDETLWRQLTVLATTLWLVTLWLYVRLRRAGVSRGEREPEDHSPQSNHRKDLKRACHGADPHAAATALVAWSGEFFEAPRPTNLRALAQRLGEGELADEIRQLDRSMYGMASQDWSGHRLWGLCRGGIKVPSAKEPVAKAGVLPALFQFKANQN
jgi:hypothetical protein